MTINSILPFVEARELLPSLLTSLFDRKKMTKLLSEKVIGSLLVRLMKWYLI